MWLGKLLQQSNNELVKLYLKESGRIKAEYDDQYDWSFLFRTFPKWYRSQTSDKNPLVDRRPWLTVKAIQFLDDIITPEMSVLEYGCGGSTLFFLDRGCRVTSVEHNAGWLNAVKNSLIDDESERWSYFLIEKCDTRANHFSDEYSLAPLKKNIPYDLILIDGKCRDTCLDAVRKTGYKGWLIYDNSDRLIQSDELRAISNGVFKTFVGPTFYSLPFTETTIMKL